MILNVKPIFQWPFQEPIDWRYRFHIFLVYFSGLNFKIQDSQELSGANLESNHWIQDSIFQIPRNSLEQILNPTPGFKIQDSQELFGANLESNPRIQDSQELFGGNLESNPRIQDSRFKIPRNSLEQILNPTPGFQDSRFKIPRNSLEQILNPTPGFKIRDSQELFGANLESILNPGFKISCKESLGILNLESWIQDLLERVPRNLES